jgi:hypothetical protein
MGNKIVSPEVEFTSDVGVWNLLQIPFYATHLKKDSPVLMLFNWLTSNRVFNGEIKGTILTSSNMKLLIEIDNCLVYVTLYTSTGEISVEISAPTIDIGNKVLASLKEKFPELEPHKTHEVPVSFWSLSPNGPTSVVRNLLVPEWNNMCINYAAQTRQSIQDFINKPLLTAGHLILWSGEPGTGKTYAIRALGWEWKDWCKIHYITDPEIFFGESATYMIQVLLNNEDEKKWRLLLLEDTGELLAADAKMNTGQGLSRLLNTVDGLIGQGLKILTMITTNENVGKFHPAISRPGRCVNHIKFNKLDIQEANNWLINKNIDKEVSQPITIAELYNFIGEQRLFIEEERKVGFLPFSYRESSIEVSPLMIPDMVES